MCKKNARETIINFKPILSRAQDDILGLKVEIEEEKQNQKDATEEMQDLLRRINCLADTLGVDCKIQNYNQSQINYLNDTLDSIVIKDFTKCPSFPKLSTSDIVISSVSGIIAVIIDAFLVGTPEVVKIYKGGENFDGSILTKAFRKLGDGKVGLFANRLCEICRVPYDISAIKDGVYPQNHRLRSLSHDPFFGLFFAVFDIIFNTTTFIDNSGSLRIVSNLKYQSTPTQKIFPVIFYLGHIISDLFTARGIPIPGFFATQFFVNGNTERSISKIAENMYLDGYDMRHLASMSTPLVAKKIILDCYFKLTIHTEVTNDMPLSQTEKLKMDSEIKKEKMRFIASSISVGGDLLKFLSPPSCCNPCSLNAPEWIEFLTHSIRMTKIAIRDKTPEQVMYNREVLNDNWNVLIK